MFKRSKKKNISIDKKNNKRNNFKKTYKNKKSSYQKLIEKICEIKVLYHCIISTIAVFLGLIFNEFDRMPLFGIKVVFGFIIYMALIWSIKYINAKQKELSIELTGDPKLYKCQILYKEKVYSNFNFILCFISGVYFVIISIILEFIKINLIGIYSLIALFFVVFCAFIVFQQYLHILFLINKISKITPESYYELLPEKTEWFNLIERISYVYRNFFIILGSLFILLFIIFSPVNSIQIIFKESFSSFKFIPLLITWIIILFAIIFMIPLSSYFRFILLQKIYDNLTFKSIQKYNKLYVESQFNNKIVYMDIILRLSERKFKLSKSYAWVVPSIASLINYGALLVSVSLDLGIV